ncbi:MAG: FHA domain-containing protein [Sedimentisphaerales bacterium]|nr:FHA domain-containing protein [Sedimentisphaerales bacterium]
MDANLVLFKKDGSQKAFSLPSDLTVIGRRHDCDLYIPLKSVSRRHCQLSQNNEAIKIRDLDSKVGTFVNGKRISDATVQAGDYITIGPLTFLLQIDGEPQEIKPPQPAKPKPAAKKGTALKKPEQAPSDSLPGLDTDGDDSFLDELENL